jgi:hypothetical protein
VCIVYKGGAPNVMSGTMCNNGGGGSGGAGGTNGVQPAPTGAAGMSTDQISAQ